MRRLVMSVALVGLTVWAPGCSGDPSKPEGELAPLVGTWRGRSMVLTDRGNPQVQVDLIAQGAVFTLSVVGNGTYSATLSVFGQTNVETGTISVKGNRVTITPTLPPGPPTTGTWRLEGSTLLLEGETEFDFNLDGVREPAEIKMELVPLKL